MLKAHYRTLWLSDIHLGSKDCKADYLLHFLNHVSADTIYLVGDIIDMWQMSKSFCWPQSHNQVIQQLMQMSKQGARLVYLPGNHDVPIQSYAGMSFGAIEIHRELIHTTVSGKQYLVFHGDQFDADVALGSLHSWVGDKGYDLLLFINRWYNYFNRWRKAPYWSLASYIKKHIKGANQAIARYRTACCNYAAKRDVDGVICGHIHHPQSVMENGIHYLNDGDWIENCSALTEDAYGHLRLIYWTDQMRNVTTLSTYGTETPPSKVA